MFTKVFLESIPDWEEHALMLPIIKKKKKRKREKKKQNNRAEVYGQSVRQYAPDAVPIN